MPGGFPGILLREPPAAAVRIAPRVFDRFLRMDPEHSNTVDGCGVGLSISQRIASAHGGSITTASEPAKSTLLNVRLLLEVAGKTQ